MDRRWWLRLAWTEKKKVHSNSLFVPTEAVKGNHTKHDLTQHVMNCLRIIFSVRVCIKGRNFPCVFILLLPLFEKKVDNGKLIVAVQPWTLIYGKSDKNQEVMECSRLHSEVVYNFCGSSNSSGSKWWYSPCTFRILWMGCTENLWVECSCFTLCFHHLDKINFFLPHERHFVPRQLPCLTVSDRVLYQCMNGFAVTY